MTNHQPSPLGTPEWCDIPFRSQSKTPFDVLVDIMVQLPSCSFEVSQLQKAQSIKLDTEGLKDQVLRKIQSLLDELDAFSKKNSVANFHTTFQATLAALFHSANIICLKYHGVVSGRLHHYEPQMKEHAEMIFECVSLHMEAGLQSGGLFNMIFPLKIVSRMVPHKYIRDQAQSVILSWAARRGLDDQYQTAPSLRTQ